jgi:large exoprotein involved in heme utilization and adhesion
LKVADSGLINVRNEGTGNAGTVRINADSVRLNTQGAITATTKLGEGGDIIITSNDLLLRRESKINATSGGTGNGGNVTIDSPIIVGLENSDIIANAIKGKGGNIQITTQSLFGLKYRDRVTPNNDITASSDFGINGNVQVNTIGINPANALNALPTSISDSSRQIADRCDNAKGGSLVATGRGGIPQSPMQTRPIDRPWSDIRSSASIATPSAIQAIVSTQPNPSLVEASAFQVDESGSIALIVAKTMPEGRSKTVGLATAATCGIRASH